MQCLFYIYMHHISDLEIGEWYSQSDSTRLRDLSYTQAHCGYWGIIMYDSTAPQPCTEKGCSSYLYSREELYMHVYYVQTCEQYSRCGSLTTKLKSAKISYSHNYNIIRMAILYRTAKFKSANILAIAILGLTAKFNSRQYFRLYGMSLFEYFLVSLSGFE